MARSMMLVFALFVCGMSLVSSKSVHTKESDESEIIQGRIESLLRDVAQAEQMLADIPYPNIFNVQDLAYLELLGQQLKYGTISLEEGKKEYERLYGPIWRIRSQIFGGHVRTLVQAKIDLPILIKKLIGTGHQAQRILIKLCLDAKHNSNEGNLVERDLIKLDILATEVEKYQYDFHDTNRSLHRELSLQFELPLHDARTRLDEELARIELLPSKCPSKLF